MDRRGFIANAPLAVAGAAIGVNEIKNNLGGIVRTAGNIPAAPAFYDGAKNAYDRPPTPEPIPQNMMRDAAFKLLRESPHIRRQVREQLIESAKFAIGPRQIDPDILILRSLSPMAKLTFARQRYIEQGLEAALNGKSFSPMGGRINDFIHQKLHELMWGEKSAISSILGF